MSSITFAAALKTDRKVLTTTLALAAATALGGVLRFYKLGEWSFWIDEVITLRQAEPLDVLDVFQQPAYRALTGSALDLFGVSEWSARMVPALVGVITIPVLYFIARRIFDDRVAMISSFLLAIAPWHIYWSQNARFYTILLLLYTLALFALYIGMEEDRPAYLVIGGMLLFLAARERPIALFLIPVVGIYIGFVFLLRFERPPGINIRNGIILLVMGIVIMMVITGTFIETPTQWAENFGRINTNPTWIFSGAVFYVGVATVVMAIFGGAYLLRNRDRAALLLTISALIPLVAVMAISLVQYAANRYMFMTLPSYLILAGVAVGELLRGGNRGERFMATGVLAVLLMTSLSQDVLYYRFQNGNRDDWRGAVEIVESRMEPGDWVISSAPNVASYYLDAPVMSMDNLDLQLLDSSETPMWFLEDMNAARRFPGAFKWMTDNADLVANLDVHVEARNFLMRVYYFDPSG